MYFNMQNVVVFAKKCPDVLDMCFHSLINIWY